MNAPVGSQTEVRKWEPQEISESTDVAVRDDRPRAIARAEPLTPREVIELAAASKMPAAELKEFMAVAERLEERNAARSFNRALATFQRECPPIKKNKTAKITTKTGGSYSYEYAELDVIEAHVKPYLERNDLSYTFDGITDEKGVLFTGICILSHIEGHSKQSKFALPIANESAMSAQQKVGAAYHFARRQTLAAVLGLSITDKEAPDDEVDPTTITDDQAVALGDRVADLQVNRAKFCEHFGVGRLEDLRATDYAEAMRLLDAREKKQGAKS